MPIRRSGSNAVDSARVPARRQPATRWQTAPSLEQVRRDSALLKHGHTGEAVRQLQQLLNARGAQLDVDGRFGPATEQAVQRFQGQNGLDPDRLVGPLTLRALEQGGSVERAERGSARRASESAVGSDDRLAAAAERAPRLGAETPAGRTGMHGLLSNGTRLTRSDIDWNHPEIRPPGGRVTQPSPQAFAAAVKAYDHARDRGEVRNHKMTLIDFSRPSTEPRMWVIDMDSKKLLAQHRVAHGSGSGDPGDARMASRFSNRDGTHQSSLGTYITAETYQGSHGRSLKLDGKEPGFNGQARNRTIVMHEADYASDNFVRSNGYLGRSWGCPAMDPAVAQDVIDLVKGGSAMLIYAPDADYLRRSSYLNS